MSPPHPPPAGGTFSSRRRLFRLPSGGIRIRLGFLIPPVCAALIHRCGGPPSPMGKVIGLRPGVYEFARGFSASVLRTDVFMVRLPLAIVYWNSLRGAPPLICRLRAAPSPEGNVVNLRFPFQSVKKTGKNLVRMPIDKFESVPKSR